MDALMANYASDSEGGEPAAVPVGAPDLPVTSALLPPPPLDLLQPPNFVDYSAMPQGSRVRSFPHVEGNYAVHVYIPVNIPSDARKQVALAMRRAASLVPDLYSVDADYALSELCKDEQKLEKVLLGREFHVSLGRPVAVQISKQILMVDEVYRLHGLPEFYKNPRPHISLVWALGDISSKLKQAIKDIEKYQSSMSLSQKCNVRCEFNRVVCKVGKKMYDICKLAD